MKKIFCFGDSWTRGLGSELPPGSGFIEESVRNSHEFRKNQTYEYSYPGQLKTILKDYDVINLGSPGCSNYHIFGRIFKHLNKETHPDLNDQINKGDIVIVGFTSILREPLTFFHADAYSTFTENSISGLVDGKQRFIPYWLKSIPDTQLKEASLVAFEDFIMNRLNFNFFHEICMNYVCQLQCLFDELGVNYIFFNAFENILNKDISFYNQIKLENWIMPEYTMSDYLCDKEIDLDKNLPYSVWENDIKKNRRNLDGPHPNRIGYEYITKLVYDRIIENKFI